MWHGSRRKCLTKVARFRAWNVGVGQIIANPKPTILWIGRLGLCVA